MAAKHFKRYRVTLGGDTAHSDWIAPPPVGEPWPERDQTPRNAWYCDAEVDLPTASEDAKIGDWAFAIAESTSWKRIAGPAWEQITGGGGEHPDLATHDAMGLATDSELSTHAAAGDPHTGYRLESADHTHQSTGLQGGTLDHGLALTGLADDDHPQYALDTDLTTHAAAADPHTGYQKESEKGAASGYASLGADTLVPQDQLGSGVQDGTKFLRDDGTWQVASGTPGATGPPGPFGFSGEEGEQGIFGPPGVAGTQGIQGNPGNDGTPGAAGSPGRYGEDGEDGMFGVPGRIGSDGAPGSTGPQGTGIPWPGPDGEDGMFVIGPAGAKGDTGAPGAGGGTVGTSTLDFGVFPGKGEATVDVTGQAGFVTTSMVSAVLYGTTADHSRDEHEMEEAKVTATYLADGSFQVRVRPDPVEQQTRYINPMSPLYGDIYQNNRLYGQYQVRWSWS
jgi:hypothetical protein